MGGRELEAGQGICKNLLSSELAASPSNTPPSWVVTALIYLGTLEESVHLSGLQGLPFAKWGRELALLPFQHAGPQGQGNHWAGISRDFAQAG